MSWVRLATRSVDAGIGTERAAPLEALAQRTQLQFDSIDRVGDDLRIVARVIGEAR